MPEELTVVSAALLDIPENIPEEIFNRAMHEPVVVTHNLHWFGSVLNLAERFRSYVRGTGLSFTAHTQTVKTDGGQIVEALAFIAQHLGGLEPDDPRVVAFYTGYNDIIGLKFRLFATQEVRRGRGVVER